MALKEYDIAGAFQAVEYELINSFLRNMKRHRVEEVKEQKQWEMWQVKQLQELDLYKKRNAKKYGTRFRDINKTITEMIRLANEEGQMDQETEILEAMKEGLKPKRASKALTAQFFRTNERKLNALIAATTHDMEAAETAILRKANDVYRKTIFNAQVYANTGAGTYEKAVDMATKDLMAAGLTCVEYKNGARHTLPDYADMALRTANKRAYLQGEGAKRQEWGVHTVIVNKRLKACPHCMPFAGKVFIDDVWGGGTKEDGNYPLLSTAIEAGLYHPRCRDSHTAYFPGITDRPWKYTKAQVKAAERAEEKEEKVNYARRQEKRYERLSEQSLDEENRKMYEARRKEWYESRIEYEGIPKSWQKLEEVTDIEAIRGANPRYDSRRALLTNEEDEYATNCANCVVAAEMRLRGFSVIARGKNKNRKLAQNPFNAWIDAEPLIAADDSKTEIESMVERLPNGARVQIAVKYVGNIFRYIPNHTFLALNKDGKCIFTDPQIGIIIKNIDKYFLGADSGGVSYCRIDNLEVSDLGVTACERT